MVLTILRTIFYFSLAQSILLTSSSKQLCLLKFDLFSIKYLQLCQHLQQQTVKYFRVYLSHLNTLHKYKIQAPPPEQWWYNVTSLSESESHYWTQPALHQADTMLPPILSASFQPHQTSSSQLSMQTTFYYQRLGLICPLLHEHVKQLDCTVCWAVC